MALSAAETINAAARRVTDLDGRDVVVGPGGTAIGVSLADTIAASGSSAAAPAANAGIAFITTPPAGRYRVRAIVWQSGTPDANAANGRVQVGAGTPISAMPSLASAGSYTEIEATVDGTQTISARVGATAGGAGAIYNAVITATRVA